MLTLSSVLNDSQISISGLGNSESFTWCLLYTLWYLFANNSAILSYLFTLTGSYGVSFVSLYSDLCSNSTMHYIVVCTVVLYPTVHDRPCMSVSPYVYFGDQFHNYPLALGHFGMTGSTIVFNSFSWQFGTFSNSLESWFLTNSKILWVDKNIWFIFDMWPISAIYHWTEYEFWNSANHTLMFSYAL